MNGHHEPKIKSSQREREKESANIKKKVGEKKSAIQKGLLKNIHVKSTTIQLPKSPYSKPA